MKDVHIQKLCNYLPDFNNLEVLSLNNNYITDTGCIALSNAIVHIKPLTMLSLEGNKIKSPGTVVLSETVQVSGITLRCPTSRVISNSVNTTSM